MGVGSPPPPPSPETGSDGSTDSSEVQAYSVQDSLAGESMCTEWTDEKHDLYLNSVEASFVKGLYESFGSTGRHPRREDTLDPKLRQIRSGQYKVFQGGCWEKTNFKRYKRQVNKTEVPDAFWANPWIQHFRSSSRIQVLTSSALQEVAASSERPPACASRMTAPILCHDGSVGNNTEVMDQNFVDKGEIERMKTCAVSTHPMESTLSGGSF
ncbi:hypothetical protein NMG60_11024236 [Bertholletia excelsa]